MLRLNAIKPCLRRRPHELGAGHFGQSQIEAGMTPPQGRHIIVGSQPLGRILADRFEQQVAGTAGRIGHVEHQALIDEGNKEVKGACAVRRALGEEPSRSPLRPRRSPTQPQPG